MKQFDNIDIYVDGACSNNGKVNAKGGYGIYFPNGELINKSEKFTLSPITNNRAELYAIYDTLVMLKMVKYNTVTIHSDSKYSINCVTVWYNKWSKNNFIGANKKPIDNLDIIDKIIDILNINKNITFKYVPRENNKDADKLAKDGCK
jgi:ribonuclease HI